MPPLAFDKDGQPFTFLPTTVSLLVRRWRNPGGRGTCEQVFDEEGNVLYVEPETTVAELRQAAGNVPGLYRLDQCDEAGNVTSGAPAAYIAIDPVRNAGGVGSSDPLLVVRDMARDNAEVSKTLANSAAGMMNAATENMRVAALGAGLGNRRMLAMLSNAAAVLDDQDGDDDDDGSDGEGDGGGDPDAPAPGKPGTDPMAAFAMLAPLLQPMLPKIGELLGAKLGEWLNTFKGARPGAGSSSAHATASASASGPAASGATASGPAPGQGGVAGSGTTGASTTSTEPPASSAAASSGPAAPTSSSPAATNEASPAPPSAGDAATAVTSAASAPEIRNAIPTGAQIGHLLAIRALLTPREVAIVDEVIARMDPPTRASWLTELSALPIEQAARHVRSHIPALKSAGKE